MMKLFAFQLVGGEFSLDEDFLATFRGRQPQWGPLGYVVYKRTYARKTCDCIDSACEHPTEEFWQTCQRVIEGVYRIQQRHCALMHTYWDEDKAQRSAQEMFERMWQFKWLPPGRGLWMMGTDFVRERGSACLQNCAFVSTGNISQPKKFADPFCFLMDMSMLGVGVGGDVRGAGIATIREPKVDPFAYVIDDSREGWVKALSAALNAYVGEGALPCRWDYSQIRPAGTVIKGFGGVSSGHGALQRLLEHDIPSVLNPLQNKPITKTAIVDLFNFIGKCVVSGNVRRAAEVMFGDSSDEFLNLKNPELCEDELRDRRWASNNSLFVSVGDDYTKAAKHTAQNGEPGYMWLENSRQYGRMVDPPDNVDAKVMGANPCFAGDTLIAVADGRGAVSIKQLAEEANDVPVYAVDPKTGELSIKMGRNPRLTRRKAKLVEIELDNGAKLRVTPDHKMLLINGQRCEAKDLQPGDSLPRFTKRNELIHVKAKDKRYLRVYCNAFNNNVGPKIFEHRLVAKFFDAERWDNLYNEQKKNGWIHGGVVVHHKDYNPLNNAPHNLEIMTFSEHSALHAKADHIGENNPMYGRKHSAETRRRIGDRTRERCSDVEFRKKLSAAYTDEEREAASERLSLQQRSRLLAYFKSQEATTDLRTVWHDYKMLAVRNCETCSVEFEIPWSRRGQSYCSISCANKKSDSIENRKAGQKIAFEDKQRNTLHKQIMSYKDLSAMLKRDPLKSEWEDHCRKAKIPFRLRPHGTTKNVYALTSFEDLKQRADNYNHRVVAVRNVDGQEDTYNMSVDEHHTLSVVTTFNKEKMECDGIFTFQCLEQPLFDKELCCLVETFPAKHESYEDYEQTLKYAYLYAKSVTLLPTHNADSNAVMIQNRRIGTSMSGIVQAFNKFGRREFLGWCDTGYKYLRRLDSVYSKWLGVACSIKITSVKPSGSVSKIVGSTCGVHYPPAEYYIQRIRFSSDSQLLSQLTVMGYKTEPCVYSPNTTVVEFPIKEEHFDKAATEVSLWEQLTNAAQLQRWWADNQVSATIQFDREREAKDIVSALELFEDQLKGVSFLPHEHGYQQAPWEPITRDEYLRRIAMLSDTAMRLDSGHEETDKFCDGAMCEIRPNR